MIYEPEEIQSIVTSVTDIIRQSGIAKTKGTFWSWLSNRTNLVPKADSKVPMFYEEYPLITGQAERIRIHAEPGIFPDELFEVRSPNMTALEYVYIKSNFKNISNPVFIDYIHTVSRCFADDNWNLDYKEEKKEVDEDSLQYYLEHGIKNYGSLETFVKETLPTLRAVDAMGIIAINIQGFPTKANEEGELIYDESELLQPQPYYHPSKNILAYKDDEYFLVLLDEKSWVDYGNGAPKKEGLVFYFYDKNRIWKIEQTGKYIDFKFNYTLWYEHNWNKLPCKRLGGIPKIMGNKLIQISDFLYVCDLLDIVLLDGSNLFIIKSKCAYPIRISIGDVCEFKDSQGNLCNKGFIWDNKFNNGQGGYAKCPACYGGLVSRFTPAGELFLRPQMREENAVSDNLTADEAIKFAGPSKDMFELLIDQIDKNLEQSRAIMHVYQSNTQVKGNPNDTALGMAIDEKSMAAFIKPKSDSMFSMYDFLIYGICYFRYKKESQHILTYPVNFDFNTDADYLFQIGEAKKNGMPPVVIETKIDKYLQSSYYSEKSTANIYKLISAADRVIALSSDEIDFGLTKGLVAGWEKILHDSALTLIEALVRDKEKFFEQDMKAQIEQLQKAAQAKADSIKTAAPAETQTLDVVNEILNGAPVA